jgi:hypothetical protein
MLWLLTIIILQFTPTSGNLIIGNPAYNNISSFTGLFQATNTSSGGLEELTLMVLLFMVLVAASLLAARQNPMLSILAASMIMVPISTLSQSVFGSSGGTIGELMPVVFIAVAIIAALVVLLSNWLSPYGS